MYLNPNLWIGWYLLEILNSPTLYVGYFLVLLVLTHFAYPRGFPLLRACRFAFLSSFLVLSASVFIDDIVLLNITIQMDRYKWWLAHPYVVSASVMIASLPIVTAIYIVKVNSHRRLLNKGMIQAQYSPNSIGAPTDFQEREKALMANSNAIARIAIQTLALFFLVQAIIGAIGLLVSFLTHMPAYANSSRWAIFGFPLFYIGLQVAAATSLLFGGRGYQRNAVLRLLAQRVKLVSMNGGFDSSHCPWSGCS